MVLTNSRTIVIDHCAGVRERRAEARGRVLPQIETSPLWQQRVISPAYPRSLAFSLRGCGPQIALHNTSCPLQPPWHSRQRLPATIGRSPTDLEQARTGVVLWGASALIFPSSRPIKLSCPPMGLISISSSVGGTGLVAQWLHSAQQQAAQRAVLHPASHRRPPLHFRCCCRLHTKHHGELPPHGTAQTAGEHS